MNVLLNICLFIPLLGFIVGACIPARRESMISRTASATMVIQFFALVVLLILWFANGFSKIDLKEMVLFEAGEYEFFIDFVFDKITAVYAFVGCVLTFLITVYSGAYLHREPGFKRFYNTVLFFYFG